MEYEGVVTCMHRWGFMKLYETLWVINDMARLLLLIQYLFRFKSVVVGVR